MTENPLVEFRQRYEHNWIGLCSEVVGITPDEEQSKVLRAVQNGERRISIRSGHGRGKMEDDETVIETPSGPKRFGDLRVGDNVFGRDGRPARVKGVYPKGVLPMFRVTFDDGTWARVGGDHLWTVRDRQGRRTGSGWKTVSTTDLVAQGVLRKNGKSVARQFEIPTHDAVEYPAREHTIPPYVLGVWLGDGARNTNIVTSADPEMPELLGNVVRVRPSRSRAMTLVLDGLRAPLRKLGILSSGAKVKRVPRSYMEAPAADRLLMLQGLMDTDGTCGKDGHASFCSISEGLVDDVAWLVRSLGGKASKYEKPKAAWYSDADGERVYGQPAYQVSVRLPNGVPVFRLARKQERVVEAESRYLTRWIASIEPDGEASARCIEVDREDGLYLTKDFIVTHNTTTLALAIVCQALTRFPQRTVATAPTSSQLFDVLAADTKALFRRLPPAWLEVFEIKSESIVHKIEPERSYIVFKTSRAETPEAMAGVHMEDGWVLIIGDEASGIPEPVYVAGHGSMSGNNATTILAGNPVRTSGFFYDTHHILARGNRTDGSGWLTFHWSCYKEQGVLHDRISPDFVREAEERYGLDTNDYRVRVLGDFPLAEADQIIPYGLLQAALTREVTPSSVQPLWGLDPARKGADRAALAKRKGNILLEPVKTWKDLDLMELVGRIKHEWDTTPPTERPSLICVDAIGLGAGVADRLNELGLPVRAVNVSETGALSADTYLNLKVELYYRALQWFTERQCSLNGDTETAAELGWAHKDYTSSGKLKVKDTGKRSPDRAEAFLLTFAEVAVGALYGSAGSTNWKEPLLREIKCLV